MGYPGDQPYRQPYLPQGEPPTTDRPTERRQAPYGSASGQDASAFDPWRRPQRDGAQQARPQAGGWGPGGQPESGQGGTWGPGPSQPGGAAGGWGPGGTPSGGPDAGAQPGASPWGPGGTRPGSPLGESRRPEGEPAGSTPGAVGATGQAGGSQPGDFAVGGPQSGGFAPGSPQSGGFAPGSPQGGGFASASPQGGGFAPGSPQPGGQPSGHPQPGGPESGGSLPGDPHGRQSPASGEPPRAERRAAAESSEPPWDPYGPVPFWRRPLVLVLAGLALIAALFAGLWVAASREQPVRAVPTPTPTPMVSTGPTSKYGYAGSRTTDKSPLTATELFGQKKVTSGTRSYLRTKVNKEKKCADGVSGTKITKALKDGRCTQLIRASYRDSKGTIIGTVGVANLKTTTAAKKVASAGGGKERQDFLKPLPGTDDITKFLGTGDAYAGGWIHGHYTVLLWFQFKDGHNPSKTELKRLYQAAMDITEKTVFPALDTRSLTGGRG